MRDYFGEFLRNPGLGNLPPPPPRRFGNYRSRLGEAKNGLSWKHRILWGISLAATGYGSWMASKYWGRVSTALKATKVRAAKAKAKAKAKTRKRLAKD